MADTLESLEIEVKHSATGAADEIKQVANAIRSVSRALAKALPDLKVFSELMGGGSINYTDSRTTQIADNMTNISKVASKAKNAATDVGRGIGEMSKAASHAQSPISNFISSLKRIAFYRFIRSIIKAITQALSEGLKWAYQFSEGISGEGHRFAEALDSMKSATTQMKAQLGSAFIGLLAAIEPVLEKIINLVTRIADAISQFFSAFTGKTYLKATETAQKWADTMKSGGKAAKEWKNQLMGFDVINRLNEPSDGGGGGGSSGVDPSSLFDDAPISERIQNFVNQIKEAFEFLKQRIVAVWTFITEHIDFGRLFSDILLTLQGVVEVVTGILSGDWSTAFSGAAHIVQGFVGTVSQLIGYLGSIVTSLLDYLYGGINNFFDWLEESTGVPFSTLRASVLGIVDVIKGFVDGLVESIKESCNGIIMFWEGVFSGDMTRVWNGFVEIIRGVLNLGILLMENSVNLVISSINSLLGVAQVIIDGLGGAFSIMLPTVHLPRFASGGFPEDGLFMANSGELVGQFSNGRTAVANNDQIIAGIERGVYNAVTSAMSGAGGNREIRVYLDGKEIGAATRRYERNINRATGVSLA